MIDKEKILELKTKFKQPKGKRYKSNKIIYHMALDELVKNKIIKFTSQSMIRFAPQFFKYWNLKQDEAEYHIENTVPEYYTEELTKEQLIEETKPLTTIDRSIFIHCPSKNRIDTNNRIIENNRDKSLNSHKQVLDEIRLPPPSLLEGKHLCVDICRTIAFNLIGDKWDKDFKKRPPLYVDTETILNQMKERYEFED